MNYRCFADKDVALSTCLPDVKKCRHTSLTYENMSSVKKLENTKFQIRIHPVPLYATISLEEVDRRHRRRRPWLRRTARRQALLLGDTSALLQDVRFVASRGRSKQSVVVLRRADDVSCRCGRLLESLVHLITTVAFTSTCKCEHVLTHIQMHHTSKFCLLLSLIAP